MGNGPTYSRVRVIGTRNWLAGIWHCSLCGAAVLDRDRHTNYHQAREARDD